MILVMHYSDVIMNAIPSLITGVSIVYSTVCSGADQRKNQSSASPVTDEFPTQRVSNAEKVSIWWRHHGFPLSCLHNLFHRWNQWWRHHGFPLSCLYNFLHSGRRPTGAKRPSAGCPECICNRPRPWRRPCVSDWSCGAVILLSRGEFGGEKNKICYQRGCVWTICYMLNL